MLRLLSLYYRTATELTSLSWPGTKTPNARLLCRKIVIETWQLSLNFTILIIFPPREQWYATFAWEIQTFIISSQRISAVEVERIIKTRLHSYVTFKFRVSFLLKNCVYYKLNKRGIFLLYSLNSVYTFKQFTAKSMHINDSNQYAIECVTYLLITHNIFFWINNIHTFERNAIDSIGFFSQCIS